jgi:hypothetical protein
MSEIIGRNIRITPGGFSKRLVGTQEINRTRAKGPTYNDAQLIKERANQFLADRGLFQSTDTWKGTGRPHSPRTF